jgi:GT2 family glycosyltransferase
MTLRLDEAYGTYYEDVEWSLRTALSGAQGIYEPLATSIHLGSATAGARSAFSTRQLLTNHRLLANQYLRPRFEREYRAARILLRTQTLLHGRWPRIGSTAKCEPNDHPALEGLLRESEQEIFRLQTQTYWDRLWRLYFKMVSP